MVHPEGKESSNDSSTASIAPKGTKDKSNSEIIPGRQSTKPIRMNPGSKWNKIQIVTKQTGNECVTAIEIVAGAGSTNNSVPENRQGTVARKFAIRFLVSLSQTRNVFWPS
ncbi:UNVERIFIED_CONTAM: hypothetical protein FKN15_065768 [Acipenser sinensis]